MTTCFDSVPGSSANIARGLAALEKVLREKTTVHRAMYRDGLGWIDFVWGDEGKWPPNAKGRRKGEKGIAHALEARQRKDGLSYEEALGVIKKMVRVIAEGSEKKRIEIFPSVRVTLVNDGTEVHLTYRKGANAWVLTVFDLWDDEVITGAMDAVSDANHPTHTRPLLSSDMGAVIVAAGAINPSLDNATHSGLLQERLPVGAADQQTLGSTIRDVNMKQPPLITYNLKERGRKHRGQERDFNIRALCDSINGHATQERVKTRAMLGYFGHKPRLLFGMEPVESGVVAGKYNEIEPAIVTTYLEAFPDGTIKHQTEFLDSLPGKKAARMFANRIGGFSSAIDQVKNELFGFDYVLDPNFSTNRGFALDSLNMTLDEVKASIKEEEEEFWLRLVEAKDAQLALVATALDHATVENEQLISLLAKGANNVLDDTAIRPLSVSLDSVNRLQRDKDLFRQTALLPHFVEPVTKNHAQQDAYSELLNRMGYN